jgi:hypothetical protein
VDTPDSRRIGDSKNNLNSRKIVTTLMREIVLDVLAGVSIIAGLYFLKVAFKKLTPEDRIAGEKELPVKCWLVMLTMCTSEACF